MQYGKVGNYKRARDDPFIANMPIFHSVCKQASKLCAIDRKSILLPESFICFSIVTLALILKHG